MQVNMLEAKSQLSKLVQAVLDGEEVIIARNGVPMVQLTKLAPKTFHRKPGAWKGKMWLADDWDSPETGRMINNMMLSSKVFPDEPGANMVREPARVYKPGARNRASPVAAKRRK